jgi:hypothetical protein
MRDGMALVGETNMNRMETIRLLVEENGEKLWRSFEGCALVGSVDGKIALGRRGGDHGGGLLVFQSASGKLVVYRTPSHVTSEPGTIEIYADFAALCAVVPLAVYDEVAVKLGVQAPVTYRELPLEGV